MLENLGKKLSNLVFEPDATSAEQTAPVSENSNTQKENSKAENSAPIAVAKQATMSADEQTLYNSMLERLKGQVYNRTTVFVQFNNALNSLESVIPDVATRYRAAFAMLSTGGVSLDSLINALKLHNSDLASEVTRFNNDSEEQMQRAVIDPTRKIEELQASQQADQERLLQIQQQMNERVEEIQNIQQSMAAAQNKVSTVANLFKSAESNVRTSLEQAEMNIKTYLK